MTDWREQSHYPDPADTSLHRWAWEFLRRNPTFRGEVDEATKAEGKAGAEDLALPTHLDTPLGRVLEKWGVNTVVPPEWKALDAPVHFDQPPRFIYDRLNRHATAWVRDAKRHLVLEFDLDAPIAAQIERAQKLLATNQGEAFPALARGRNRPEKFSLYLRVLDALMAQATSTEILNVLSREVPDADERMLRYWTQRAIKLRDGGYRDLLKQ